VKANDSGVAIDVLVEK
jgi:hypothetical protein